MQILYIYDDVISLLSTQIILPHLFTVSAFVTYSCFEWCTPWSMDASIAPCSVLSVLNVYLHN